MHGVRPARFAGYNEDAGRLPFGRLETNRTRDARAGESLGENGKKSAVPTRGAGMFAIFVV